LALVIPDQLRRVLLEPGPAVEPGVLPVLRIDSVLPKLEPPEL